MNRLAYMCGLLRMIPRLVSVGLRAYRLERDNLRGVRRSGSRSGQRARCSMLNAYLAPLDTMEGATILGSVSRMACEATGGSAGPIFKAFQQLMQEVLTVAIREVVGIEPEAFVTQPAPESERGGNS